MTVLYRGARYELGRGPGFYGIWLTGAPQSQPFEWWHESPEGWYGAWHRLTTRWRLRGNVDRIGGGDCVGADVHDDLVDVRVIGGSGLAAQECLGDDQQRVGEAG